MKIPVAIKLVAICDECELCTVRTASVGETLCGMVGRPLTRMILVASLVLGPATAPALEWDADPGTPGVQGGSGVWASPLSWWDGTQNITWVNDDMEASAVFGGVPGTVEAGGVFVKDITFNSPYKIIATGNALFFRSGVITVSAEGSGAEIAAGVQTMSGLTKEGSGTLTFSLSLWVQHGSTIVNEGTLAASVGPMEKLVIDADGTFRLLGGNTEITELSGSGLFDIGTNAVTVGKVVPWNPGSPLPPPATFFGGEIIGTGSVTFRESAVFPQSAAGNSFTGPVTIVNPAASGPFPAAPIVVTAPNLPDAGQNSVLGAGREVRLDTGTTLVLSGAGVASSDRNFALLGNATLSLSDASAVFTLENTISGAGSFTKQGSGTLVLSATNTYGGSTNVNLGVLVADGGAAIPDASSVMMGGQGTLRLLASESIGSLSGTGTVDLGANTLMVQGSQSVTYGGFVTGTGGLQVRGTGVQSFTGVTSNFTGGVSIVGTGGVSVTTLSNTGVPSPLGTSGSINLGDETQSGRFILSGNSRNVITDRPFSLLTGGGVLEVTSTSSVLALSGPLTGTSELEKRGEGRLRLVGDKAFTGSIDVTAGILDVAGDLPADVQLLPGGTFETSGTETPLVRALTFAGGVLSLGGSGVAAALNTGNLNLGGGTFVFDLQSALNGHDQINVEGAVSLDAPIALTIKLGFDPVDFSEGFRLIVNDGADPTTLANDAARFVYNGKVLEGGEHFLVEDGGHSQYFAIDYGLTPEENDVRMVVVPEPGSAMLLAGGVLFLGGLRRRRESALR